MTISHFRPRFLHLHVSCCFYFGRFCYSHHAQRFSNGFKLGFVVFKQSVTHIHDIRKCILFRLKIIQSGFGTARVWSGSHLLCDFLNGRHRHHIKVAAPALVIDEETVFDASLDGLLGRLHPL